MSKDKDTAEDEVGPAPESGVKVTPAPLAEMSERTRELMSRALFDRDGEPLTIFTTIARHPKLFASWLPFASRLLSGGSLDRRLTELVILRVAWNMGSDYEWGQHAEISAALGIPRADIDPVDAGSPVVRPPPEWRVSSLAGDANVELAEGSFGKRGLVATLTQAGLPRAEIRRVAQAFEGIRRIDRPRASDTFVLAKDKGKGTLVAFEYATSPFDVWQARRRRGQRGRPHRRQEARALRRAPARRPRPPRECRSREGDHGRGLRPEIALAVDDALEGHVEPGPFAPACGCASPRREDWVEGAFVRVKVEAIEFVPKSRLAATGLLLRARCARDAWIRAPRTGGRLLRREGQAALSRSVPLAARRSRGSRHASIRSACIRC